MPSGKMNKTSTAQEIIEESSEKPKLPPIIITRKEIEKIKAEEEDEKKETKKEKPKKPKKRKRPIKIKSFLNKILLDSEDKKAIKNFIIYSALFGVCVNYSMFVIFDFPFTYYSWLGWGIGLWLIENKFVSLIRKIIRR